MTDPETQKLLDKITKGVKLAIRRLIEERQKEDGELVISENGKVKRIKARSVKLEP
jgi:hypothetical protein